MSGKKAKLKRWPEIFIGLTIIGVALLVGVVLVSQMSGTMRDSERREAVDSFYGAVELFNDDYGFYPNYTMTLGLNPNNSDKLYNYDLASEISLCTTNVGYSNPEFFAVSEDLVTPELDINKAQLKPGFKAVGGFLVCTGYMQVVPSDPVWAGTVSDYQYRVSSDYKEIVVETVIERGNDETFYHQPNGVIGNIALHDRSDFTVANDPQYYQAFEDRAENNGSYLYQCLQKVVGGVLTIQEKVSIEYKPFIRTDNGAWQPNANCKDSLEGLLVVKAN